MDCSGHNLHPCGSAEAERAHMPNTWGLHLLSVACMQNRITVECAQRGVIFQSAILAPLFVAAVLPSDCLCAYVWMYTLARTHARTCDAQWRYCKAGRLRHRIRTSGKSRSMSGESLPEEIVTLCAGAGRGRAPTTHTLIMMCHAQALCQHVSVARFA